MPRSVRGGEAFQSLLERQGVRLSNELSAALVRDPADRVASWAA
jgi:hypothetical protein